MKKLLIILFLFATPLYAQNWEKKVQIKIQAQTSEGQFNDAIYFTDAEYAALTKDDIDAQVQKRIDDWVNFVQEQSQLPPYVPTKEELIEQSENQTEQLETVLDQLIAKQPTKAEAQEIIDKLQAKLDELNKLKATAVVVEGP